MVTARDVEKVISLLRRIYNVVIIDSPPAITDTTLAFLDDADSILSVVTPGPRLGPQPPASPGSHSSPPACSRRR